MSDETRAARQAVLTGYVLACVDARVRADGWLLVTMAEWVAHGRVPTWPPREHEPAASHFEIAARLDIVERTLAVAGAQDAPLPLEIREEMAAWACLPTSEV